MVLIPLDRLLPPSRIRIEDPPVDCETGELLVPPVEAPLDEAAACANETPDKASLK